MIDEFGMDIDADTLIIYTCKCGQGIFLKYKKNKKIVCRTCKQNMNYPNKNILPNCNICGGKVFKERTVILKQGA